MIDGNQTCHGNDLNCEEKCVRSFMSPSLPTLPLSSSSASPSVLALLRDCSLRLRYSLPYAGFGSVLSQWNLKERFSEEVRFILPKLLSAK